MPRRQDGNIARAFLSNDCFALHHEFSYAPRVKYCLRFAFAYAERPVAHERTGAPGAQAFMPGPPARRTPSRTAACQSVPSDPAAAAVSTTTGRLSAPWAPLPSG